MTKIIYADNAATTAIDSEAFEVYKNLMIEHYGNSSQPYSFARQNKKALKEAREIIAKCINADPDEIYFTSGGTESNNWAIKCAGDRNKTKIITSKIEHHSILNSCEALQKKGFNIVYLPVNEHGVILKKKLFEEITEDTKIVSLMLANNEIGTVEPIKDLCEVVHSKNLIFHTDAVQALGHIKIDVKELGVDLLSASAHKFNGPKGIGFLYIKKGTKIYPLHDGGKQEMGLRAGTEDVSSIFSMAIALRNNCKNIQQNNKKLLVLENIIITYLDMKSVDYIRNGDKNHIPGNLSLSFKSISGEMLLHRLDLKGIMVSTGSACDGMKEQVSHVIKALNVPVEYNKGTIRISLSKNNTEEEAENIAKEIVAILKSGHSL